ncbi:MAG: lipocalin family protein [Kineosporiaceae bacterium]
MRLVRLTAVTLCAALLALGAPVAAQAAGHPDAEDPPVRPIADLDLERYQGRWLQLAAIPQPFDAFCDRDTTADYALLPDGLVQVVNTCTTAAGFPVALEGRAQVVGPDSDAQLEVTFDRDATGQFVFTGESNYWVIGIDERDYGWAVVGNGERTSGFVLSRDPELTPREIARVLRILVRNGYDPCDFEITATTGGIEENRPLCHL